MDYLDLDNLLFRISDTFIIMAIIMALLCTSFIFVNIKRLYHIKSLLVFLAAIHFYFFFIDTLDPGFGARICEICWLRKITIVSKGVIFILFDVFICNF